MDNIKIDTSVVREGSDRAFDGQIRELSDLQLALVGGGIGDPVAA